MNWTGGRLQRHSKSNSNKIVKTQKEYFAKARLNSQRGVLSQTFFRQPTFNLGELNNVQPPVDQISRRFQRSAVHERPGTTHQQENCEGDFTREADIQTTAPIELTSQHKLIRSKNRSNANETPVYTNSVPATSLEATKRKILEQPDWVKVTAGKPLRMDFDQSRKTRRIARHRRETRTIAPEASAQVEMFNNYVRQSSPEDMVCRHISATKLATPEAEASLQAYHTSTSRASATIPTSTPIQRQTDRSTGSLLLENYENFVSARKRHRLDSDIQPDSPTNDQLSTNMAEASCNAQAASVEFGINSQYSENAVESPVAKSITRESLDERNGTEIETVQFSRRHTNHSSHSTATPCLSNKLFRTQRLDNNSESYLLDIISRRSTPTNNSSLPMSNGALNTIESLEHVDMSGVFDSVHNATTRCSADHRAFPVNLNATGSTPGLKAFYDRPNAGVLSKNLYSSDEAADKRIMDVHLPIDAVPQISTQESPSSKHFNSITSSLLRFESSFSAMDHSPKHFERSRSQYESRKAERNLISDKDMWLKHLLADDFGHIQSDFEFSATPRKRLKASPVQLRSMRIDSREPFKHPRYERSSARSRAPRFKLPPTLKDVQASMNAESFRGHSPLGLSHNGLEIEPDFSSNESSVDLVPNDTIAETSTYNDTAKCGKNFMSARPTTPASTLQHQRTPTFGATLRGRRSLGRMVFQPHFVQDSFIDRSMSQDTHRRTLTPRDTNQSSSMYEQRVDSSSDFGGMVFGNAEARSTRLSRGGLSRTTNNLTAHNIMSDSKETLTLYDLAFQEQQNGELAGHSLPSPIRWSYETTAQACPSNNRLPVRQAMLLSDLRSSASVIQQTSSLYF